MIVMFYACMKLINIDQSVCAVQVLKQNVTVFPDLPGADKDQVQQRLHGHEPGQSDHHSGTE